MIISVCLLSFAGSSGYESPSKPRDDDDPAAQHVRVKRPSVTVTSPGSPGLPRRGRSPIVAGEIQVGDNPLKISPHL